ncbi:MAG: DUF3237 family protein [Clostridia bacterium]|nr:DUF3237 family protein [Clostridia bacterium]
MTDPIMLIHVRLEREQISRMKSACGEVTMLPFSGTVESELFTGTILPGGVDVQVTDPAGCRHLCARYMLEGVDREGNSCRIYVDNNGWFRPEETDIITACPRFMTDSPVLADILSRPVYRSEVHGTEAGVDIHIFDTTAEKDAE